MPYIDQIMNALKNYSKANRNPHLQQHSAESELLANEADALLKQIEEKDTFDINAFNQLANKPNAVITTGESLREISKQLQPYYDFLKRQKELEAADPDSENPMIPFTSTTELSASDVSLLPYIKNWPVDYTQKNYDEIIQHRSNVFTEQRVPELVDELRSFAAESFTELDAANRNVYFGSTAYRDFMREMRNLNRLLTPHQLYAPKELQDQCNTVLELGQRYLDYKAGYGRTINPKGERRIQLVNKLVNKLALFTGELTSNDAMMTRAKEHKSLDEAKKNDRIAKEKERAAQELQRQQEAKAAEIRSFQPDIDFLYNAENVFDSSYDARFTRVNNYDIKHTGDLPLDGNFNSTVNRLAVRNRLLQNLRNKAANAEISFDSNTLYSTAELLYQVFFRPDHIKNTERMRFPNGYGSSFETGVHVLLTQTEAFQTFYKQMQSDNAKYRDFVLQPQNHKDMFKQLITDSSKQLAEKLKTDRELMKQNVSYLLDYKNVVNKDYKEKLQSLRQYVDGAQMLPEYQGGLPRKLSEILPELGMTETQYNKVNQLTTDCHGLFDEYGPNTKKSDREDRELRTFHRTMRILGALYLDPALNQPGSEAPIPAKLIKNSDLDKSYDFLFTKIPNIGNLSHVLREPDKLLQGFLEIKPQLDSLLTKEAIEQQAQQVKESIDYLKDYRNLLYPDYVTKTNALNAYLATSALYDSMHGEQHNRLNELGLEEAVLDKIRNLADFNGNRAREHMDRAATGSKAVSLNTTLYLLTDIYCNPAIAVPGNTMPIPRFLSSNGFNSDYFRLYEGLSQYAELKKKYPDTTEGKQALAKLLVEHPKDCKTMMRDLYHASCHAGLVTKFNQNHSKEEQINFTGAKKEAEPKVELDFTGNQGGRRRAKKV